MPARPVTLSVRRRDHGRHHRNFREVTHSVATFGGLIRELRLPEVDLERVVWESLRFLPEREIASSILPKFSLDVIPTYFPEEYGRELPKRL